VKSVNHQENDGYEDQQMQRRTDHWLSQASRGRAGDTRDWSLIDAVTLIPERDEVVKMATGPQLTQLKSA
jgi:hypothetical protein